jgi:BlaI family transcriptional regulator, penicillinase repressor
VTNSNAEPEAACRQESPSAAKKWPTNRLTPPIGFATMPERTSYRRIQERRFVPNKPKSLHGLGRLQAEVLEFVWQRGEATVADVVKHLGRRRPIVYTTVLVAMQKLEKKGWLGHRVEGRAYVYQPAKSKATAQAGVLSEMLDAVFGGDPKLLVTQLLDSRPWTPEELAGLRQLIEARRKEKGKTP